MNKNTKKIALSASEGRFGVILENIDSKIDLVLEGHHALDTKIDRNHEEFREFRKDTQYRFKTLIEMAAKNTEDVEIMKNDIEFIKNSLKKKIDVDEFAFMEKRVALLERKIQRIKN